MVVNQPPLDQLVKKVNSKYTLVVVAAKRARQLTEKGFSPPNKATKPVTVALQELAEDKIRYERPGASPR